jgi:hypothetical protein
MTIAAIFLFGDSEKGKSLERVAEMKILTTM